MAAYLVVLIRLIIPLSILKRPFTGAILAMIIDIADFSILQKYGFGFMHDHAGYEFYDKMLDMWYLSFEFYMSLKWHETSLKGLSAFLFFWRLTGFLAFEFTGLRYLLMIFPNLFESFYLFIAARNKFFPNFILSAKKLAVIISVLLIQKIFLEYSLHVSSLHIVDTTLALLRSSPKI